jgi:Lipocalin-like domain
VNRLIMSVAFMVTMTCGLALPREYASAEETKDLVGTWSLVSSTVEQNGQKRDAQGPNPKGLLILDSGGHYAVLTFRQDQPKFASNNRLEATAEESRSLLAGTLGHYGTYSPAGNVLVFHIERSTFPNWNGIEQKRPYTLNGDELTYVTPGSTGSGATQLVWKRLK